jgi:ribonuclease-3
VTSEEWPGPWVWARLAYQPRDVSLFASALTHRSASSRNYERLEFLGDAVLNLVVAQRLYRAFPEATEGDLSRLRARLVSSEPLAQVAAGIGLGDALQLGSGELKTGGFRRESILADALEAVCGALFLDGGFEAVEQVIHRLFEPRILSLPAPASLKDAKTRLQEYLQGRGHALPRYAVERVEGEAHAQTFHVICEVPDLGLRAQGSGLSRRRAEQEAAERILHDIETP